MINKNLLSQRSAEIMMVLKGRHNLFEDMPEIENNKTYLDDLAAYLSDDCMIPLSTYATHMPILDSVVQSVVTEYIQLCRNPSAILLQYFDTKRLMGDRYTDTQCWCAALALQQVKDDAGEYINGFTKYNTAPYTRKNPFIP